MDQAWYGNSMGAQGRRWDHRPLRRLVVVVDVVVFFFSFLKNDETCLRVVSLQALTSQHFHRSENVVYDYGGGWIPGLGFIISMPNHADRATSGKGALGEVVASIEACPKGENFCRTGTLGAGSS
jgi:hypothetical protein